MLNKVPNLATWSQCYRHTRSQTSKFSDSLRKWDRFWGGRASLSQRWESGDNHAH